MAINVKDKLVTVESLGIAYSAEQGARQEADQALSTRIDNIVAPDGDPSLTEVSDARVSGQTTHNTLKARLDADQAAVGTEIAELKADLGANANNIRERGNGTHVFSKFESGAYNNTTGAREASSVYIRSVEKVPIIDNVIVEFCNVPTGHSRSDYGVRFVYWDSRLDFIGITAQVSTDAALTSIPTNAAYLAVEIISKTNTAITVESAPTVTVNWFDVTQTEGGKRSFDKWLEHTSYSANNGRFTYDANAAFSREVLYVDTNLRYAVSGHENNDIANIYAWEFDDNNNYLLATRIYNKTLGLYTTFKPTENTAYIKISVNFNSGHYGNPGVITLDKSDKTNLLPSFGLYTNETVSDQNDSTKKVEIIWDGIKSVKLSGTMSQSWNSYDQRIYYSATVFPNGIKAGDKLYFSFANNDLFEGTRGKLVVKNVCLAVMFFFGSSSNRTTNKFIYESTELDIPAEATGMQIVLRVQRGQSSITLNTDGTRSITYVYDVDTELNEFTISTERTTINVLNLINRKNMPCLVSFIDDDAENDLFCSRYYNACMHNGITGAYAVQTDLLDSGATTPAKMLEYEEQGMGMLTHCSIQTPIYRAATEAQLKACLSDLINAKRKMIEYGFATYNHFVIPYGTKSDALRDIARYCDFESAISTSDNVINYITDNDRYYIKRFGYLPEATYQSNNGSSFNSVLNLINQMIKIGAGWVIITTHFCDDWSASDNQWQSFTYDTSEDANGYEIGYSEFNDLVSAIKATGAKIVQYTVGLNYFHSGARG